MALIDDIKIYLRITGTAFNTELTDLIAAAQADLSNAGIVVTDTTNALLKRAIGLYCKAHFGYDNPDADRFMQSYDMVKRQLMLSLSYGYYTVTITADEQCIVIFNGEEKETDDGGVVVFYSRAGNHIPYYIGSDAVQYVDVTGNTTIPEGD